MPRLPPPPSGPAAAETIEEHIRIGRSMIARAMDEKPELDMIDALVAWENPEDKLDPSTVGRYRSDLRYALLAEYEARGALAEFERRWPSVNDALTKRRGKIAKKNRRTSAKKVEDATEEEARALFYELKRHALAHGNMNAVLAALFVLVARDFGFRPVELCGAHFSGNNLVLPNAKKRPGKPLQREMDMTGVEEDVQLGIKMMIDLIDHDLTKREFARWQKVLAGQMWRACKRIDIRVLSLYSFRHIAIASWSAAGLSPAEIAALCGHTSIRTAHAHYARAGVGHKLKSTVRAVAALSSEVMRPPQQIEIVNMGHISIDAQAPVAFSFEVEDVPTPSKVVVTTKDAMSSDDVAAGLARHIDRRSADEIGASLRNAANQAGLPPQQTDSDKKK